ncbi:hypothetical protein HOB76_00705 [Candidatus Woesearchaeota archaeon]|nr:hypothetical protein [Candidatus Woesearchaeota archaeon]
MRKIRKAQASRVFIYAISLFVIILILFYGYKSVNSFMKRGEEVVYFEFQQKLKSNIDTIKTDYGSQRVFNYVIPEKYDEVCFLDTACKAGPACASTNYPIIQQAQQGGIDERVFMRSNDVTEAKLNVGALSVQKLSSPNSKFGCVNRTGSQVEITLKGLGNRVAVVLP